MKTHVTWPKPHLVHPLPFRSSGWNWKKLCSSKYIMLHANRIEIRFWFRKTFLFKNWSQKVVFYVFLLCFNISVLIFAKDHRQEWRWAMKSIVHVFGLSRAHKEKILMNDPKNVQVLIWVDGIQNSGANFASRMVLDLKIFRKVFSS